MKYTILTAILVSSLVNAQEVSIEDELARVGIENAYEDDKGHLLIQFKWNSGPSFLGNDLFFYGDETGLHQLDSTGSAGTSKKFKVSFADDRLSDGSSFVAGVDEEDFLKEKDQYLLICGEKRVNFKPASDEKIKKILEQIHASKTKLTPLPSDERRPAFLLKRKADNQYIYIDHPRYSSGSPTRIFVGAPGAMNEREIEKYSESRSNSLELKTKDGETLFVPSNYKAKEKWLVPMWNQSIELEKLDASKFDLSTLKIPGVPSKASKKRSPCDQFFPEKVKIEDKAESKGSEKAQTGK